MLCGIGSLLAFSRRVVVPVLRWVDRLNGTCCHTAEAREAYASLYSNSPCLRAGGGSRWREEEGVGAHYLDICTLDNWSTPSFFFFLSPSASLLVGRQPRRLHITNPECCPTRGDHSTSEWLSGHTSPKILGVTFGPQNMMPRLHPASCTGLSD